MRKLILYLAGFVMLGSTGCLNYGNYRVESDYSYRGQFDNYKSFDFFDELTTDTSAQNMILANAIRARMNLQGYKLTKRNPNLLVSYKVYFGDMQFKGYDQPDIEYWVKNGEEEEEDYNAVKYNLREGTLLVSFYDNDTENVVWQGYVSGVFGYGDSQVTNERYLKRLVRSIFDQFKFVANDFIPLEERRKSGD